MSLNQNLFHTSTIRRPLPLRLTLLLYPKSAGFKPLLRLLVGPPPEKGSLSDSHLPHRTKFAGNCWCPGQEGGIAGTTVVRSGDPVSIHSTTQGSPRVGDIWRSAGKLEASAADGERDGISSQLRQTHLRGTHRIPGSWVSSCYRIC